MVQFFDPAKEQEAKRRRLFAEQMMKQSQAPAETQVVGGYAVEQSPLLHLARAIQGGVGQYNAAKADQLEVDAAKRRQQLLAEAVGKLGEDQRGAGGLLMQDPTLAATGLGLITDANKTDRAQILADAQFRQRQQLADEAAKNARIAAGIKAGTVGVDAQGNPTAPTGGSPQQKALDVKNTALEVTDRLLNNLEGVKANRGSVSTAFWNPNYSDESVNAEADLETLASLLTTENLGLLKGVLSDSDMRVLKDIGAGGIKGADDQVIRNLGTIRQKLGGQIQGMGGAVPPLPPPIPGSGPPGKLIGTSNGKKVFQLPDGSHVIEE